MAFSYKATITVTSNSSLLPATQTNYPLWVDITNNALKTVANGGAVTNVLAHDVVPFSDSSLTSALEFEMETTDSTYDGAAGRWRGWVKIPSLALGTVFYIGIGNAAITTQQSTPTNVWDADFQIVMHMTAFGGAGVGGDSTSNARHGTVTGTTNSNNGQLNEAQGFDGSGVTKPRIETPLSDLSAITSGTISWWAKPASAFNDSAGHMFWGQIDGGGTKEFSAQKFSDNNFYVGWFATGNDDRVVVAADASNYPNGQWAFYEFTWTNGGNSLLRCNGTQIGSQGSLNAITNVGATFMVGSELASVNDRQYWLGELDEFRLSDIVRSPDWSTIDYNSQDDPSTFISYSVTTTVQATPQFVRPVRSNLSWR